MKATSLLEKQHRKVEAIFKKLSSGNPDAPMWLSPLADDLIAHMSIEQTIFYPAIRSIKEDLVLESYEEHALAELALKRLLATDPHDVTFHAKVTTLKELIEHHVKEEEDELFPKVEKAFGDEKLEALGKEMKEAFDQAVDRGFEVALPKTFSKTTADATNKPVKTASPVNGTSSAHAR
jgi:hemerythrin superfamily protein